MEDRTSHWNHIYLSKEFEETSWYQEKPEVSLRLIESLNLSETAQIIDIGGGDSYLVDNLLELGYRNISVLDISVRAVEKGLNRLGEQGENVNWIVSDSREYKSPQKFDLWHDRAAFHFLTDEQSIAAYISNLKTSLRPGGYFILGTFSEKGPDKCSGIRIKKYSAKEMKELFRENFNLIHIENIDHSTPWDATQNFTFGVFQKI
ncbi:class I SAM-dependent methyltransferase [Gramella sp. KN1008]|uniref:class I SAM-dependent methyltransferase n=1 Tax=Gramella sp. KN1008 TaxID=2529298 RepID=UPI00103EB734|nr:class I SAM-dependent methyltransferase [Gramella sp. KN1008]TBW28900.1 class I SAM-dependent methyltransferase [Gramella sp. KN1008]